MPIPSIEKIERRQLLAGVTLLAPAWNGGLTGWLDTTINAITTNLGGPANVPQYVLTIAPNSDGTLAVQGVTHVAGTATPSGSATQAGQILVTIDYTSVSTNPDYPFSQIASLVTNFMENTPVDGVRWAELPIHEISTSRGTGLMDEIAKSLDESGIWVDQQTYLDPHPIEEAPFNDAANAVYDNVEFADDYWRTSGEDTDDDPAGHPIDGAYNLELTGVQADYSGFSLAHLAPPAYYDGTIDPSLTSDGDGPIHPDWYGDGTNPLLPAADQTGYLYTNIVGGTRPLSGVWPASGGTGARTAVTHSGTQWPNIADVAPSTTTLASGTPLPINFIQEDQQNAQTATFFLDSDQNPYDGTAHTLGQTSAMSATTTIESGSSTFSTAGVAPGTYWIGAKVSDGDGLYRYSYSQQQITITDALPITLVENAHSHTAVISGTSTKLISLGAGANGVGNLIYTWNVTHVPAGAKSPVFSINGKTSSATTVATFSKAGTYHFQVAISDQSGDSILSDCSVDVAQTATGLRVSPHGASVKPRATLAVSTAVYDQFGHSMDSPPAAQYSVARGSGTIGSTSGIFTAGRKSEADLIQIEDDQLSATLGIKVV